MGKIKKILENELIGGTQSTDVYPVTSTKAVYDTGNKVLDDYIQHLKKTSTFAGIATPTTNPGTHDGPVFYIATQEGIYSNFAGFVLNNPGLAVLYNFSGSWSGIKVYECIQELGNSTSSPMSQKATTDVFKKIQEDVKNLSGRLSVVIKKKEFSVTLREEDMLLNKYYNGGTKDSPTYGTFNRFICLNRLIKVEPYSRIAKRRLGAPSNAQAFFAYTETDNQGKMYINNEGDSYDEDKDIDIFTLGANSKGVPYTYIGVIYSNERRDDYKGTEVLFNYGLNVINPTFIDSIAPQIKKEIFDSQSKLEVHDYFFNEAFQKEELEIITSTENLLEKQYWYGGNVNAPIQGTYNGFHCTKEIYPIFEGGVIKVFAGLKFPDGMQLIVLFSESKARTVYASECEYDEQNKIYTYVNDTKDVSGNAYIKAGINFSEIVKNPYGIKIIINYHRICLREQPKKEIQSMIDAGTETLREETQYKFETDKDTSYYYLKGKSPKNHEKKVCLLIGGQSNANGTTHEQYLPEYLNLARPFPNVLTCNKNTNNDFIPTDKIGWIWGFDLELAYRLSRLEGVPFYTIKHAIGASSIDENGDSYSKNHWTADYERIKEGETATIRVCEDIIKGCVAKNPNLFDIRAMLWHQGEGDYLPKVSGKYYQNFKNVIAYIRGVVGDRNLPFIYGTISHKSGQYSKIVEDAQLRVAEEDPYCFCIDMSGANMVSDNVHFDADANIYLAQRFFDTLVDLGIIEAEKLNPVKPWEDEVVE